ncbi:hypothetical protein MWU52_14890 [Jannaschia sp. S6380]|uniref:hypothetical protein n=1 Tax=Jannaschia sp. S6380 TaxID=2926408 RepID=UPI001FF62C52|nr:hypothetical protein [Jannaschia sp. S6380]MCK0168844.1 hypothetical protein [Jannaschia sp. S6380]
MILRIGTLLLVAACQPVAPDGPGAGRYTLVPAPGGLNVEGSGGREIGFGRDRPGVLQTVERVERQAPRAAVCGPGRDAVLLRDGTRLIFEDGTFVGWDVPAGAAGRGCT